MTLDEALETLPRRRVLVVSDRYPPDDAGGAEISLHLALREPALREQAVVLTFDKALAEPRRRTVDGVEVLALPAPAAWPLDRLSQAEVDRLKGRPPLAKWGAFAAAAGAGLARGPWDQVRALALTVQARPHGGVAMDHRALPGGLAEAAVRRAVERLGPRLVHADNARAILAASGALQGRSTPLVAAVRDHRFTSPRFDQRLDGPAAESAEAAVFAMKALTFRQARLGRADVVLAGSDALARTLEAAIGLGVVRAKLTPVAARAPAPEPQGGFSVLVVGSLTPNKGQAALLEAWPTLRMDVPAATLTFAGAGPDLPAIRRRIDALGLKDAVRLAGRVDAAALARLFDACHVVALPTVWDEPVGRVPLEAGAAGRPVVAYAAGGHAETIAGGESGLLIPPGDMDAFIAALGRLAGDSTLRARLAAGALRRADAFAPAAVAGGLARIWAEAER